MWKLYVTHFTALQYRHNEGERVPGIIPNEKGLWVRLHTVTTGSACVAPETSIPSIVLDAVVDGEG